MDSLIQYNALLSVFNLQCWPPRWWRGYHNLITPYPPVWREAVISVQTSVCHYVPKIMNSALSRLATCKVFRGFTTMNIGHLYLWYSQGSSFCYSFHYQFVGPTPFEFTHDSCNTTPLNRHPKVMDTCYIMDTYPCLDWISNYSVQITYWIGDTLLLHITDTLPGPNWHKHVQFYLSSVDAGEEFVL